MPSQKKCANAACSCTAAQGSKYCSPHCEGLAGKVEVMCLCGHSHCGGAANG